MLKRLIFKIVAVFLAGYSFLCLCAGIGILLDEDIKEGKVPAFILAIIIGVLIGLGARKLFRLSRKPKKEVVVPPTSVVNTRPAPTPAPMPVKPSRSLLDATIRQQEVPQHVLDGMRMCYTGQQAVDDMRVIDESLAIMEKTSDIDTFLSRCDVAMKRVLTLEQAKKAGIPIALQDDFSKTLVDAKEQALVGVLYRSFKKELDETAKLKTDSGKFNRIEKYKQKLQGYEDEFDLTAKDAYNDVMNQIEFLQKAGNNDDLKVEAGNSDDLQNMVVRILTRSVARKKGLGVTFETSDEEDAFFRELVRQAIEAELNPNLFYFEPMSNKAFSVYYQDCYVGKIKLNGRKRYMQVLGVRGAINSYSISDPSDYLEYLPKWIKYMKHCLRN